MNYAPNMKVPVSMRQPLMVSIPLDYCSITLLCKCLIYALQMPLLKLADGVAVHVGSCNKWAWLCMWAVEIHEIKVTHVQTVDTRPFFLPAAPCMCKKGAGSRLWLYVLVVNNTMCLYVDI